jgi:hypothetical protein
MGWREQIGDALVAQISNVTVANLYSIDVKTVTFDKVKINIADYNDHELPAVQIIDAYGRYNHEMSRSKTQWFLAVELCLRTTEAIGEVSQKTLWNFLEDVVRSIMITPKLGLPWVVHCKLVDGMTDLHLQAPNYTATIGLEILFYEPITRDAC